MSLSSIIYVLIFILNVLTEFEFFRDIDVNQIPKLYFFKFTFILVEMFPFIFLSSQVYFINLMKNLFYF